MSIRWDPIKNERLKRARGVSLEEIVRAAFVTSIEHPKRRHQKFLKTAFPGRVYTKKGIRGELG